jgi:hypothetical protein
VDVRVYQSREKKLGFTQRDQVFPGEIEFFLGGVEIGSVTNRSNLKASSRACIVGCLTATTQYVFHNLLSVFCVEISIV